MKNRVIIIGAGPAGLTVGYLLTKAGWQVSIIEADPTYVGGISKTVRKNGFLFDIGGHRFFSKSPEVNALWRELLPNDLLERPRSSRIYYRGKLFLYPLRALDALRKLGVTEAMLCVLSYYWAKLNPIKNPRTFSDWVSNQFGKRLFNIFFKTYTEKVWGMKCEEISADWAAQRIQGLSLAKAILTSLLPARKSGGSSEGLVKTLINSFLYPRKGPGMMWEAAAEKIKAQGGDILMASTPKSVEYDPTDKIWRVSVQRGEIGTMELFGNHLISSVAIKDLTALLQPKLPPEDQAASVALKHRDFMCVTVMLKNFTGFDDNWIYIHDPEVKVGRIQNFKSWSPEMVPGPEFDCLGLEYFCFESDGLWNCSDAELSALAIEELKKLNLLGSAQIVDTCVVRQKKAYPIYDEDYQVKLDQIRKTLDKVYPTLHLVGRNGMHRYNNQDHAMMTAMLTVKNILAGEKKFDVWQVNQDAEYLESSSENEARTDVREVPKKAA
jgi:protoporphyrinogen oxidase